MNIMNHSTLLQVRNLECSYSGQAGCALCIDHMDLEFGKMHFVLGRSGIGKSTLIEALGLMEQTMGGCDAKVTMNVSDELVDLQQLWDGNDSKLSKFRQENFSFIFQSTNLLSNLSLRENVLMPAWIAKDELAEERIEGIFERLLPELSPRDWGKEVSAISGGQRQRLAFMRALVSPFKILFGDEPTGNLDFWRADRAMSLLANELKSSQRTACIVSHDIDLSVKYADTIFLLTPAYGDSVSPDSESTHGALLKKHIFKKSGDFWVDGNGEEHTDLTLRQVLKQSLELS